MRHSERPGSIDGAAETAVTPQESSAPELTVVVPCLNERENVPILIERLRHALAGIAWEVIFVDDDSPDGTAAAVRAIGAANARVRCIRRIGRRGLAGACIEGMLASQARYLAVIDSDLQHDETLLAPMLATLRTGDADLVVGTRYAEGGAADSFSSGRKWISGTGTKLSNRLLGLKLTDPLSGFFMIERTAFERVAPKLSTQGFKILLDIAATAGPALRTAELPYTFGRRAHGNSKLDTRVALDCAGLVLGKATSDLVSMRFIVFCLVGLSGIAVHFGVLTAGVEVAGLPFEAAQAIAIVAAIAYNFALNNLITYRDLRLEGWSFLAGLAKFYLICSVAALSNLSVGHWLFSHQQTWLVAGLAGALVSVAWNYVVSSLLVWHVTSPRRARAQVRAAPARPLP